MCCLLSLSEEVDPIIDAWVNVSSSEVVTEFSEIGILNQKKIIPSNLDLEAFYNEFVLPVTI